LNLRDLLEVATTLGASDLHLITNAKPSVRIDGELRFIESEELSSEDIENICFDLLDEQRKKLLNCRKNLDFAFELENIGRFRANFYFQKSSLAVSIRLLPNIIPAISELGLPSYICELYNSKSGLILITGSTGSGKSTTLAAIIDDINQNSKKHIITIEDPIEFVHNHKNSIISQRSIGEDSEGFDDALKYALRQDPNVIMIGEMRDAQTINAALLAAQTGHLVLATLHTNSAVETISRIVSTFENENRQAVRTQLADCLLAVISQFLIVKKGGGRALACEVLVNNKAVANLIREDKSAQLYSQIQLSQGKNGMQTLSHSLSQFVKKNIISKDLALEFTTEKDELQRLLSL
jgi:twitching motility protein PilT